LRRVHLFTWCSLGVLLVFIVYLSPFCFVVGHFVQWKLALEISWLSVLSVSLFPNVVPLLF